MQYWLLKTEPEVFSWDDLVREKVSMWDGVRNYAARNNLRAMAVGDLALIYYSVKERAVVGIARIVETAFPDPTTDDDRWSAVRIEPVELLPRWVRMEEIKAEPELAQMILLKISRLSVQPLTHAEFEHIRKMAARPQNG